MNKHESEVIMAQLMSERKTLRSIGAVYEQAMRDIDRKLRISDGKINTLLSEIDDLSDKEKSSLQSQIYQRKFQRSLKSQLNIMLKDLTINQYSTVNEHLKNSYHNGYIGSLYNLNMQGIPLLMPIDPYLVHRAIETDSKISEGLWQNLVDKTDLFKRRIANHISRGIATAASYKDIAVWLRVGTKASIGRTMTVARTEGNRIYNAAALDCGKGAKKRGCDLIKVWDCTLDMKTRPTHRECDGQIRELEESFKNANGEAKAPGQFGIASEDINCRCAVLIKPRWDVDSRFTKRDNQTGELKEFEGVKSYREFKKRYWESVDKSGESGIIKSSNNVKTSGKYSEVFTKEQRQVLDGYISKSPDYIKNVYNANIYSLYFGNTQNTSSYFILAQGVNYKKEVFDAAFDVNASFDSGIRSIFHEQAHAIDSQLHLRNTFKGKDVEQMYSYCYKRNAYGKALEKDVDNALNAYMEDCRQIVAKATERATKEVMSIDRKEQTDFLEMFGLSKEEIAQQIESDINKEIKKKTIQYSGGVTVPSNRAELERQFSNHIRTNYSKDARICMSDTFEGYFKHVEFPFGSGHGRSYWGIAPFLKNTEAFANMFSSYIEGGESMQLYKKYMPEATKVFEEMLKGVM